MVIYTCLGTKVTSPGLRHSVEVKGAMPAPVAAAIAAFQVVGFGKHQHTFFCEIVINLFFLVRAHGIVLLVSGLSLLVMLRLL